MRRLVFPLVIGLGGVAVLVWLGVWQLQRLEWKEAILAGIDARKAETTVPLPPTSDLTEAADEYRPVLVSGRPTGEELHVLTSGTAAGTGYRVIAAFETMEGRTILLDRGLLPVEDKALPPATGQTDVTGTLIWPDETTGSTPAADVANNIWFARNVEVMSRTLGTEPVMVVETETTSPDPRTTLLPVTTTGIPNDHLEYAITWFMLALVWAGMTGYFIRRTLSTGSKD